MALKVMATIIRVVRMDARTCFMGASQSGGRAASVNDAPRSLEHECYRKPDQSSATRMESLGLEGSYFTLACCPAIRCSNFTWLSSPVMSCAV